MSVDGRHDIAKLDWSLNDRADFFSSHGQAEFLLSEDRSFIDRRNELLIFI